MPAGVHLTTKRINMKTLTLCICSSVLAVTAMAQQLPSPSPAPSASASVWATASASPGSLADKIHQKLDKKLHGRHGITIDGGDSDLGEIKSDDLPEFVIPIVAITMLTIFGAPVLIVAFIMYFGFSKSRMQHRTIRMLAEKGQPIPPALLAPRLRPCDSGLICAAELCFAWSAWA